MNKFTVFGNHSQQANGQENIVSSDNKLKHRISETGNKIAVSEKKKHGILKRGRKHHRRYYSNKHEASNCGTKEPKGPSETHIEWQPEGKVCPYPSSQRKSFLIITRLVRFTSEDSTHPIACCIQVLVQNSRRIRNRIRRKYRKDTEKRRHQRHHKRMQHIHRVEQMEELHRQQSPPQSFSEPETHTRSKRSVSSPRHVEALVVADPSMVDFHQDRDVETYLLTIMNMVSSLYKDPAIGNLIKVVVVRIVLLEEDNTSPDFNVTHAAEKNLMDFCRYFCSLAPVAGLHSI